MKTGLKIPVAAKWNRAFTLIDLLAVITIVAVFAGLFLPALLVRVRERMYITVDLNNVRQILRASALYSSENNDYLAHPTWGGNLSGPDGWAYLTSNNGRVPGGAETPGQCIGRDVDSPQFTNQVLFFKYGQVGQYLQDVKVAWCPKDVATRRSGRLRTLWLGRPMKVTSYCWNGTIGGYVGRFRDLGGGKTYKVSDFLPGDWPMWEQNENESFYFNDAGNNPESTGEVFSLRHSGLPNWYNIGVSASRNLPGGAVVGTFGGAALFVNWSHCYDLLNRRIRAPNELLNGPAYR